MTERLENLTRGKPLIGRLNRSDLVKRVCTKRIFKFKIKYTIRKMKKRIINETLVIILHSKVNLLWGGWGREMIVSIFYPF